MHRKKHFEIMLSSFKADQTTIDKYQTELLFLDGKDDYWLLVQRELIPLFENELQKGDEVTLYIEWIGANKFSESWN